MNAQANAIASAHTTTAALILAAGQGTRMKSVLPKVMHPLAGRPMIYYPVKAALDAGLGEVVVVVGHGREHVIEYLSKTFGGKVRTAVQEKQLGTGDAAKSACAAVSASMRSALLFYGDVPLLTAHDLSPVVDALLAKKEAVLSVATCTLDDPFGYGRILRDASGNVTGIREQKDCSDAERKISEINPGIYAFDLLWAREALEMLRPNNAQGEYYLTDLVSIAAQDKHATVTVTSRPEVLEGINDRHQLAIAEEKLNARIVEAWRKTGVTIRAGARIEESVTIEPDATIETGVVLRGKTSIGRSVIVDVGCVISNVSIAEGALIKPYSVLSDSTVGPRAQIGPFSHVRPESVIGEEAHLGNFVETKKTRLDKGAKANHLAYLGDGIIGAHANVGAGTIFCNYDGYLKHTTTIEEGAFIGSDSQIVAPVTIGKNSYVGTGTTVTKNVPEDALALSRVVQVNKEGYAPRIKARLKAAKDAKLAKK